MYPAPDSVLPTPRPLRFHPLRLQNVVNQQGIVQELHRLHRKDGIELQDILVGHPPHDHQPTVACEGVRYRPFATFVRCLE